MYLSWLWDRLQYKTNKQTKPPKPLLAGLSKEDCICEWLTQEKEMFDRGSETKSILQVEYFKWLWIHAGFSLRMILKK